MAKKSKLKLPIKQIGGIVTSRGQWDYPGQITIIPSNEITMRGVPYNVLGVSDTGDTKMMQPGGNYKFKGKKVTEYPQQTIGKSQTASGGLGNGGKLTYAGSGDLQKARPVFHPMQTGGSTSAFPVSLQERQNWNDFARYAHQDPNFGNPDIYDKDTQYGYNKLQEYNKVHPENLIRTPEDVARIQQGFTMLKANPEQYGYPGNWGSGKDLKVDKVIGTQTSSTLFPAVIETINHGKQSTITNYGQDYEKYQAAHPVTPPIAASVPSTTPVLAMNQFGGNVTTAIMKKKLRMAQNGTGLSGPVLRSGPNVKNSAPPNATVTKASPTGNFVNSTFPMQLGGRSDAPIVYIAEKGSVAPNQLLPFREDGGHNWQTPQYGWGQSGMKVGPYQDGGQMPGGDQQQAPPSGQSQVSQDPQQQQIMQLMAEVENALQQGASPKEVAKTLAKQGVPRKAAQQLIQQVMSQSAQQEPSGQQSGQDVQSQQQGPPQQQPQGPQQGPPQAGTGLRMRQTGGGDDQVAQFIGQALQQGHQPQEVMQMLVQKGVKPQQAQQMIQQVMQQMQSQQGSQQGPPQAQTGLRMMATGPGAVPNTDQQLGSQVVNPDWAMTQPDLQAPDAGYPNNIPTGPSGANPPAQFTSPPGTDNTPSPVTGQVKMRPKSPWYTGDFYADRSIDAGNRANTLNQQYTKDNLNTDPKTRLTDKQLKREHQAVQGNQIISDVSAGQSVWNGLETGTGLGSKLFADNQAKQQEMEQQFFNNNKNRQMIKPDRGNASQPAFAKDGYVIPYGTLPFQMGGAVPTQGSDFQSGNPNVMTERGETITDPTKGPMGSDGQPTGAVVHDTTGDEHSDPSGGNAYQLGADSVVHSKILGIKVGDFLAALRGQPHAAYIAGKITEKFPNPDKEVSYAQLAKVFETKKLAQEVEKIAKKAEKIEQEDPGNQGTKITRKTNELNQKTLARKDALKKEQMATNTDVTGSNGPIHQVAEGLKMQGAYGPKIQQETAQSAQGNPPTAGTGIKMKGKKMLLPTGQDGIKVPTSENDDPNFPGSQPVDMSGTPLASSPVSWADIRPDTSKYNYQTGPTVSGINNVNIGKFYKQYQERGAASPGWLDEFSGAVEKGDIRIPASVDNWEAYNQTLNKDGTYGPGSREYILNKENEPGMEYMRNIGNKYGERHFDPTNMQLWKDPVTGQMVPKGGLMMRDFEKQTNDAYKAQGAQPYFTEDKSQPFGFDMFGAHHMSVAPWVNQSYGGSGDSVTNDPDMPIIYNQTQNKAVPPKDKKSDSTEFNPNSGVQDPRSVYREGLNPLNIAGPLASLFMRRDPAPYIEDQGAKNALASNTRQQFYNNQAEKAEIQRAHRAATQYNPQNSPWVTAQSASNAYMAGVKSDENAANINAGIQKRYEDRADALREKAGTNKAQALDSLAKRTAEVRWKSSALDLNSIGDIGKAYMDNKLENRKAGLIQGMFRNATWDPIRGTYIQNPTANIAAGAPDFETRLRAEGLDEAAILRLMKGQYYEEAGQEKLSRGAEEDRKARGLTSRQTGGKIKRINPKRVKSK